MDINLLPSNTAGKYFAVCATISMFWSCCQSCYLFPAGIKDPCEGVQCSYGAECVRTKDSLNYRCQCPLKCDTFGDNVGSKPVCGDNGKDYRNSCELKRESCQTMQKIKIKYYGECEPCADKRCDYPQVCQLNEDREPECRCAENCSDNLAPVCGTDGKTYSNVCRLKKEACRFMRDIRTLHSGPCNDKKIIEQVNDRSEQPSEDTNPCKHVTCEFGSECDVDRFGQAKCICPQACQNIMQPVCGSDNNTYDSHCELLHYACNMRLDVKLMHYGSCGTNLCSKLHCSHGEECVVVRDIARCRCPQDCNQELKPVCGSDGITYQNECLMKQDLCNQKRNDVEKVHDGECRTCNGIERCHPYAYCDRSDPSRPICKCPKCSQVHDEVCGSDGNTYQNECKLRQVSCQKEQLILINSKGRCELCAGTHCINGEHCENGRCVCPLECPDTYEPVCASDGETYINECSMKKDACRKGRELTVVEHDSCEDSSGSGEGSGIEMPSCANTSCKFNGICVLNEEGTSTCSCNFNCPAVRSSVCGSDGRIYPNECHMREASCLQQQLIYNVSKDKCPEDLVMEEELCDGMPAIKTASGRSYNCTERGQECPTGSYCHLKYHNCCPEEIVLNDFTFDETPTCSSSEFGCCADGFTSASGKHFAGCQDCQCFREGSTDLVCNPILKKCNCKPGVVGDRCDRCLTGYWGLALGHDIVGCRACKCHPIGSLPYGCDQMTGRCVCRPGIKGDKCDQCSDGSPVMPSGCYGDPSVMLPRSCHKLSCYFDGRCEVYNGIAQCVCDQLPCLREGYPHSVTVCGSDFITYQSECHLKRESCRQQVQIEVQYHGPCEYSYQNPSTRAPLYDHSRRTPYYGATTHPVIGGRPRSSFKTTRHVDNMPPHIPNNITPLQTLPTHRPTTKKTPVIEARIKDICLDDSFCSSIENSLCSKGVCTCQKGYIATKQNTHCSAVGQVKTIPTIHDNENPCTINPCRNQGICILDDLLGYRCLCPFGKTGATCRSSASIAHPSFSGLSYMTVGGIQNVNDQGLSDLTIEIQFHSINNNGLLLFSSGFVNGSGDFVSLSLVDGYVEFRYDLGHGMAKIRSQTKIPLNSNTRVLANRVNRDGLLFVNDIQVGTGMSPPYSVSLDLRQPVYLGNVPDVASSALERAGVEGGFVGCIRKLQITTSSMDKSYDLGYPQVQSDVIEAIDIDECGRNPCQSLPCHNGGTCLMADTEIFTCICATGYSGEFCQVIIDPCVSNICHQGATCQTLSGGSYVCICPDNREGDYCEQEKLHELFVPEFNGSSYLVLPAGNSTIQDISIKIWLKAYSPNGMLLFASQYINGGGDFLSVNLDNGFVDYRFNLGSGTVIVRSTKPVELREWHEIYIEKQGRNGTIILDNSSQFMYSGVSKGVLTNLNINNGLLYMGGYPNSNMAFLPVDSSIKHNFTGVIQRIYLNGRLIDNLQQEAPTMFNVKEYNGPPCSINPCMNGGVCIPKLNEVDCKCTLKYLGQRCEKRADAINKNLPVKFDGTTYLQYPNEVSQSVNGQRTNKFSMKFKCSGLGGLILVQQSPSSPFADYIAVAVVNGHVELSYNLGRQTENQLHIVRSSVYVNDGHWHTLSVERDERLSTLQVDDERPIKSVSAEGASQLDTDGKLWIGGKWNMPNGLPSEYYSGFMGCLQEIYINDINLQIVDQQNNFQSAIQFCM